MNYILTAGIFFCLGAAFATWRSVKVMRQMTANARDLSERMRRVLEDQP